MITPTQMYWLVKLDDICAMFGISAVMLFVAAIVCMLIKAINGYDNSDYDCYRAYGIRLFAASALAMVCCTFMPSTKQMAAILVVPRIANSEKVQTVGNKLYDLAVEWMDELRPRKADAKEAH